jgi:hypothetical protein
MTLQFIDILGLSPGVVGGSNVYPAVDVNDTTQAPQGTTKQYTIGNLFNFILNQLGLITTFSATAATTGGNLNAIYNNGSSGINATLTDNSGTFAPLVIDGITTIVGQSYLIKDQTSQFQNGIYFLTQQGNGINLPWILIRTFYFNSNANIINGELTFVTNGFINANTTWQLSAPATVTVGVSNLTWTKFQFFPLPPPPLLTWTDVVGTSISMVANNGYMMDNAITRVNGMLPTINCPFGSIIRIAGRGTAGWQVTQQAAQIIYFDSLNTTMTTGSLSSTNQNDCIELLCRVANTEFEVLSSVGNITII